ncbi:helix-turn-helix transcriptional regulator [Microbispora sp. RL4-1S]|uniref:Helix-turn-helix transcriptional regulator n=1 Tax=Microbispora oryzae TaxID=2806554 RepID=A0A941AIX6_9ACTN|nr:helix-turn-helix transcriptional regulator [Microbispora oryzae]MBP2704352.1 helix-turn-helix transcriptional regulator [Microbispora oryzae]
MAEIITGRLIRLQRERRGMSTTALAAQTGCTTRHIELIEQGKRTPSLPMLREIAKVLGVRTAVLLGEVPRDSHEPGRPQIGDIERAIFTYRTLGPDAEPPDTEQLTERVESARQAWYTSPHKYSILMRALPGLISDAERLVQEAGTPGRRRDACQAAANTYILARGVLKHLGRVDLAHLAADRAMRYAEETDTPTLTAWAHWNLGQSCLSDDMHDVAYDVARRGIERFEPAAGTDTGSLAILGGLHLMAAIALTRAGGDQQARDLLRGPALRLARRVDERVNHYGLAFGPTNVAIHMASIECETRQPEAALRVADEVDLTRVQSIERRTTHLSQIARACEDLGDDAASLVYLTRIERECPEELDHKILLRQMVQALALRARPSWAPEVRYLADRHSILV